MGKYVFNCYELREAFISIYYKRLEKGTFELPATHNASGSITLDVRQLQFILQGVSLRKVEYRPRLQKTG